MFLLNFSLATIRSCEEFCTMVEDPSLNFLKENYGEGERRNLLNFCVIPTIFRHWQEQYCKRRQLGYNTCNLQHVLPMTLCCVEI